MTTAVTGGTGFIGHVLVHQLIEEGEKIRLLVRASSQVDDLAEFPVEIVRTELNNPDSLRPALSGCNQLYHLAAYARNWAADKETFFQTNVEGLRNVLEASVKSGLERVVYASSSVTKGPSLNGYVSESTSRDSIPYLTEYEESKALSEKIIPEYLNRGLEIIVAQPTRVYGPGKLSEANSVTRMVRSYLKYRICLILNQGQEIANYVYVNDVAEGLRLMMKKGRPGEHYILGGENISLSGFFDTLEAVSGKKALRLKIAVPLALTIARLESWKARAFRLYPFITEGWVRTFLQNWAFSHEKATRELGYRPKDLMAGLKLTCRWLGSEPK
jgi:farnesol dehydrogenase